MEQSLSLVSSNNKELVIDDKTRLAKIYDKNNYTKLIMKSYKNVFRSFKNVKEITIDGHLMLDNLFGVEKLKFTNKGHTKIGYVNYTVYSLVALNLKSIEFAENMDNLYYNFLELCENLEEIIFNVSSNSNIAFRDERYSRINKKLNVSRTNLKIIIIKNNGKEYTINLDYKPEYIESVGFSNGIIFAKYQNDKIQSYSTISNEEISTKNRLNSISNEDVTDNCLYIPDYITEILKFEINTINKIEKISICLDFLKSKNKYINLSIADIKLYNINSVEIRNNNDMALFNKREYLASKYGELNNIQNIGNKLLIEFKNCMIKIDEYGNEQKLENNKEVIEEKVEKVNKEDNTLSINNYTTEQLEHYLYYKKLLEYISNNKSNDKELSNAFKVVENRLVKKITNQQTKK